MFVVSRHNANSRLVCKSQILKRDHRSLLRFAACVQMFSSFRSVYSLCLMKGTGYLTSSCFSCTSRERNVSPSGSTGETTPRRIGRGKIEDIITPCCFYVVRVSGIRERFGYYSWVDSPYRYVNSHPFFFNK